MFPFPSGISVLLMLISSIWAAVMENSFRPLRGYRFFKWVGMIGRFGSLIVSVPFGDVGSSNLMYAGTKVKIHEFPSPSGISVLLILSSAMQHSCGGKCSFSAQKPAFLLSKILYRDFGWEERSSHPADCTLKDTKIPKVSGSSPALSHSHPFGSSRIAPRFPLVTSAW